MPHTMMRMPNIPFRARASRGVALGTRALALGALALALGACTGDSRAAGPFAPQDRAANGTHAPAPLLVRVASSPPPQAALPETSPYGDFLAARQAERDFDAGLSARLFARVLPHAPDNPALQRLAMQQMIAAGEVGEAARIAQVYLAHEPDSVIGGLVVAVDDLANGRTAEAERRLAAMPQRGLAGYFVPLALAWTRIGLDDFDGALKGLAPLGALRGGALFHDYHAALILDLRGDFAAAKPYLAKLKAENYAGYGRVAEMAGGVLERAGAAEEARALYLRFLERDPGSLTMERALARLAAGAPAPRDVRDARSGMAEGLANMAALLSQEGVPDVAMILARMALAVRPGFDVALLLVGDILDGQQRAADAIAAYGRLDNASPLAWAARIRAAQLLDRVDRTDEAVERLRAMAAERPERADALVALGDLLRFKERYEEAIEAYDAAFGRVDPAAERYWALYYSRGIALERAKRWPRAEENFLKALEFRPDQPHVLNYLGYSWVEQGRHLERALEMIERAVKLRPNDGYIVDSLGWAHYRLDNFDRAVHYLERAVELRPQDATINDHLGDAYWRVGRRYEARFQWRRALALGPEPGEAPRIEKKLEEGLPGTKREAAGAEPGRRGG